MFERKVIINMHHTDAAGVIFHGRIFELTTMIYEEWLKEKNIGFRGMVNEYSFIFPIVNCNANFFIPVFVGDELNVILKVISVGRSSIKISFDFLNSKGDTTMNAEITIVVVDKVTKRSLEIPRPLFDFLYTN